MNRVEEISRILNSKERIIQAIPDVAKYIEAEIKKAKREAYIEDFQDLLARCNDKNYTKELLLEYVEAMLEELTEQQTKGV